MLDKVWLVLPPDDADADWYPRSVFETSEQAVAALTAEADTYEVKHIGDDVVDIIARDADDDDDDDPYVVRIVAVPIEYKEG